MEYSGVLFGHLEPEAPPTDPSTAEIRDRLREISSLFSKHFDQNWLLLLLEKYPIDSLVLDEIRGISDGDVAFLDFRRMEQRVILLEDYVRHLRRYILPGLREKLGISGLTAPHRVWAPDQLLFRQLIAHAFPHNVQRLENLASELRQLLGQTSVPA